MKTYLNPFSILIIFTVLNLSCNESTIEIPKPCTEDPDFTFSKAQLNITTDTVSNSEINLMPNGFVNGKDVEVKIDNFSGIASYQGVICKDRKLDLSVSFENPPDNGKLRIVAEESPYKTITGNILYCPNINNVCNYDTIGRIGGYETDHFYGYFYFGIIFAGEFSISY